MTAVRPEAGLRERVLESVGQVMDPCSLAMGRPLDLVSMGIVEKVEVTGTRASVRLVLTDPNCFLQTEITRAVSEAVHEVPGIDSCDVVLDGDVLWTPDRIVSDLRRAPTEAEPAAG